MSAVRLPADARRRQLLDVALEVFAAHGYHDTVMDQVAESAGVTKPVLYQHFTSKRELYLSVLDEVGSQLEDHIAEATAGAGSPRLQVAAGFSAYFRFVKEQRSAMTVLLASQDQADPEFTATAMAIESVMAATVGRLIDANLDPDHRRLLAHGIVGMATGTGRHWINRGLDLDPAVVALQVADLAWAGLRGIHRIED